MAMLSDWRSYGCERDKIAAKNLGEKYKFVAFINQDMNDEWMVTLCDIAIYFNDREELFDKLSERLARGTYIQYSAPEIYDTKGKIENSPLVSDINSYLLIHREEAEICRDLYHASWGKRLTRYFGLAATPVPPSRILERTLDGQKVTATGVTIPVFDPILAVAVARGKISLDI